MRSNLTKYLYLVLFITTNYLVSAQTNREAVKVTDWGELMSTYNLTGEDEKAITEQSSNQELVKVKKAYTESQWPSMINTLDARNKNRPVMYDYKVYKVAVLPEGEYLVVAPKAENTHMPEGMKSDRDLYFVIGSSGINGTRIDFGSDPSSSETTEVTDWSELMSTFSLTQEDEKAITEQSSNQELIKVKKAYTESQWPSMINTLDARNTNRPLMYDYKIKKVAILPGGEYLIVAPKSENTHMPEGMKSDRDLYFVIGSAGINGISSDLSDDYVSIDFSELKTFDEQLGGLLLDLSSDFSSATGNLVNETNYDLYLEQYESLVIPEGAKSATINFDYDYLASMTADYGTYTVEKSAAEAYNNLKSKIDNAKLDCCYLEKGEEIKTENDVSVSWTDYDAYVLVIVKIIRQASEGTSPSYQIQLTVTYP